MSRIHPINAGFYRTEGGAAFGVLPRTLWEKDAPPDERHRIRMAQNLLLIESEGKRILVDTGLGNRCDERTRKIYSPEDYRLFEALAKLGFSRADIDFVVFTHLHFDHVGGLLSRFNERDEITFPNAMHVVQRAEWEMAVHPDLLNRAAYNYESQIAPIAESGLLKLIDGDFALTAEVTLIRFNGHSEGFQAVRVDDGASLAWFGGDLFPTRWHLKPPICFAYDVCRRETAAAKMRILRELETRKGTLYFSHDPDTPSQAFA
jgi:glyoxylase-like metal-dependent hydrolase (beta-lactamase superfamily II)